jgi:dihydrofolate reductase
MEKQKVSIICALGIDRGIGKNNALLWKIPNDLQRFKKLTLDKVVIMGRKTHESIGRILPERKNFIITIKKNLKLKVRKHSVL